MLTGEALGIVLKMAKKYKPQCNFGPKTGLHIRRLEAEAIKEVEFLLKGFEDTGDYTEDDYMEERY